MNAETMIFGRYASDDYRAAERTLRREALLARTRGEVLTARIWLHYATIAKRASVAELADPEPRA